MNTNNKLYFTLFKAPANIRFVNWVTFYRILVAPLTLIALFVNEPVIFRWLLLSCFFTDAIDGYLARKLSATSDMGTTLDTIGDTLTFIAAVTGIVYIEKAFVAEQAGLLILVCALFVVQAMLAFYRYKKLSSFHTYLAKIAAVCDAVFILFTLFFGVSIPLFYICAAISILELVEEVALVFILPSWQCDVKGIFWVLKRTPRQF